MRFQENRFQENLTIEDRLTYRRSVSGLFIFYFVAIAVGLAVGFLNRPGDDLRASNETQTAHLKARAESATISRPASAAGKQ